MGGGVVGVSEKKRQKIEQEERGVKRREKKGKKKVSKKGKKVRGREAWRKNKEIGV